MPVPAQRDPGVTRDILATWLGDPARLPGARITDLQTPEFSGFSSETLMVDVECGDAAEALAVRVAPLHYKVFPETRFAEEYRLMRILDAGTDIPVPPVLWYEPDPGYLGAPFLVMRRIEGRVPTDMPPYHTGGWVAEISPAERQVMWWSGLDILARLHRLDVTALQLSFLDQPQWGKPGLDQRLGYYEHYMNWAYPGPKPTATRALAWLKEHQPSERNVPVLLWGDSRIGNIIYAPGGTPLAVLDWEMATHAILCIVQEDGAGRRLLEEAVRVWPDGTEYLGRPTYAPSYAEGTRDVVSARIGFSPPGGKPFDMEATLLLPVHLMVGTGYGLEPDWKHGMYQGHDLVVQGVGYDLSRPEDAARMWGMVDAVARFDYDGHTGYGLYEYWALGDHPSFR